MFTHININIKTYSISNNFGRKRAKMKTRNKMVKITSLPNRKKKKEMNKRKDVGKE